MKGGQKPLVVNKLERSHDFLNQRGIKEQGSSDQGAYYQADQGVFRPRQTRSTCLKVPSWVDPQGDCFANALPLGCDLTIIDEAGNRPAGVGQRW